MYIDENGGADGELKVTVEGEEYTAETTFDIDDDGIEDSAVVETGDGGHLAFTDTDRDGDADLMSTFDHDGKLVAQARFDVHSGEWIAVDPADAHEQTNTNAGHTMIVDTDTGDQNVGVPTEDTDGDGRADTAVVKDEDGDTWLFTDVDGDGKADLATEITRSGEVTMTEHTAEDTWTEVERGHIDSNGKYVADSKSGVLSESDDVWVDHDEPFGSVSGVVRIDSTTGQWISPN
ncbi:DUF6802 family protein [Umezawaea tangerina]|uniref:DUF6802 domain-containing protein n=1 Tax=Umezawaea tangerina TaxID=84725 RepID=A0A2T0TJJ2_9PSEU|nr:DUF6802 family protein [Umezawaea tangerina]PRY45789.1 hypothetical protein CLV43_10149 [Umezawaea tangerina]